MNIVTDSKRITCAVPETKAVDLVRLLHKDKGIHSANIHRGRGRSSNIRQEQTFGKYVEVEIVTVIVDSDRADEIFEFMYFAAGLDSQYGGFIYQVPVVKSTVYKLPDDVAEEEEEEKS